MAYTEKVSLNGTALSFLLYECINSSHSQEGFLIGDVTSEITNHISDSQSDNARLDTQIIIRTVLPLPSVSLFYLPTGRIKDDVVKDLLSDTASEVVGWYKFRKNNSIKPTFRDKLISKGLQKYFEKFYGRKHFVLCNLSNRQSSSSSTHTLTYRFGKINCFDMYEYIEDVTANLGEKLTGYKKPHRLPPNSVFNKIIKESGVQVNNTSDAILRIQEAVDIRLKKEAKIAAKNENIIRELEAEIKQMTTILSEKQAVDLQSVQEKLIEEKLKNKESEMAEEYVSAIKKTGADIFDISYTMMTTNNLSDSESSCQLIENIAKDRSPSPVLVSTSTTKKSTINYANALKNSLDTASTSKTNNYTEDLITFDMEDKIPMPKTPNNIADIRSVCDSSPEY